MKTKDLLKQLRGENAEALTKRISDLNHELMNLRFRKKTSQLSSSGRITQCKREIARAKTILAQQANQ
jgi:large subunit ribosomal protein L29